MTNTYLQRYACEPYGIDLAKYADIGIAVVIPCHAEPDVISSLEALENCEAIDAKVLVVVVINASESASKETHEYNQKTYQTCLEWAKSNGFLRTHRYEFILENNLLKKHAGVGLARKIGMDEVVRIFDHSHQDGVIVCYDADSRCDSNYLKEIERAFSSPKTNACSIHFEHPLNGGLSPEIYDGITQYELHLRYYVDALRWAGFPYAYQTIGSSMAVRSSIYMKQGGMNKRKAGEEFYFLHKIMPLGGFIDLNSTKVIPSPRCSDRVPFGTGRAIGQWLDNSTDEMLSYHPKCFEDLKRFFEIMDKTYQEVSSQAIFDRLPESVKAFVSGEIFLVKRNEIMKQSTNKHNYDKRFFQWFDGFKVLKFVHFCRDEFYPKLPLHECVEWLFSELRIEIEDESYHSFLLDLREFDRGGG